MIVPTTHARMPLCLRRRVSPFLASSPAFPFFGMMWCSQLVEYDKGSIEVAQLVQCAAECFLGGPNQPANSDPELPGLFKTFLPDQAKHLLDKLLEAKR
mmetsp:Transcript_67382/g.152493  ORF Transcript_67382/g.152493 Transcript_67382/m.152493 type:complete len:99 (-) Transcript_67382:102-398(-)